MFGRRAFFLLTLSLALAGCASKYMHPASGPVPIAPRGDAATVVFVRPSSYAAAVHPTILDERGTFLGDAEASSHFVVTLPPGEHMFLVWAENTGPIRATLLPDRVYFVEVAMKPGALQARAHLLAIAPDTETWPKLRDWIADTKPTIADQEAGQAYLNERRDDVLERLRRAREAYAEMDEEDRNDRTLHPNDGIAQPL
jgi:hypothetical protein